MIINFILNQTYHYKNLRTQWTRLWRYILKSLIFKSSLLRNKTNNVDWQTSSWPRISFTSNIYWCWGVDFTNACTSHAKIEHFFESYIRMITKPENAVKHSKTWFCGKSLISREIQGSKRVPPVICPLIRNFFFGGLPRGPPSRPSPNVKNLRFFE